MTRISKHFLRILALAFIAELGRAQYTDQIAKAKSVGLTTLVNLPEPAIAGDIDDRIVVYGRNGVQHSICDVADVRFQWERWGFGTICQCSRIDYNSAGTNRTPSDVSSELDPGEGVTGGALYTDGTYSDTGLIYIEAGVCVPGPCCEQQLFRTKSVTPPTWTKSPPDTTPSTSTATTTTDSTTTATIPTTSTSTESTTTTVASTAQQTTTTDTTTTATEATIPTTTSTTTTTEATTTTPETTTATPETTTTTPETTTPETTTPETTTPETTSTTPETTTTTTEATTTTPETTTTTESTTTTTAPTSTTTTPETTTTTTTPTTTTTTPTTTRTTTTTPTTTRTTTTTTTPTTTRTTPTTTSTTTRPTTTRATTTTTRPTTRTTRTTTTTLPPRCAQPYAWPVQPKPEPPPSIQNMNCQYYPNVHYNPQDTCVKLADQIKKYPLNYFGFCCNYKWRGNPLCAGPQYPPPKQAG